MDKKSDSEFESPGQDTSSGKGDLGRKADDETMTSGGRKGNFSDKERDSESQWSPGSSQSSD